MTNAQADPVPQRMQGLHVMIPTLKVGTWRGHIRAYVATPDGTEISVRSRSTLVMAKAPPYCALGRIWTVITQVQMRSHANAQLGITVITRCAEKAAI